MAAVRTLLIDNYDSYTYNLFQLIAEVNGVEPLVVRNDEVGISDIKRLLAAGQVHNIVISPGPGTPAEPADIGVCSEVLSTLAQVPVLGVCLGHQALGHVHGAAVVKAPEPVHGRLSELRHSGHPLFEGIPSGPAAGWHVVRYHSLLLDPATLPPCLEATAWTCGPHQAVGVATRNAVPHGANRGGQPSTAGAAHQAGLIMAVAHRSRPHYGVQFHPESVATRYGLALIHNFRRLTAAALGLPPPPPQLAAALPVGPPGRCLPARPWAQQAAAQPASDATATASTPPGPLPATSGVAHGAVPPDAAVQQLQLVWQKLPPGSLQAIGGTEPLFLSLFSGAPDTFWLDSAATDRGRFSYMGGRGGPLWCRITYKLPPPAPAPAPAPALPAKVGGPPAAVANGNGHHHDGGSPPPGAAAAAPASIKGTVSIERGDGSWQQLHSSFFDFLEQQLRRYQLPVAEATAAQLPFNFWGGFVGYLGYELKAECGGANAHAAPHPDACLFLADQLLAVDHQLGDVWVLALCQAGSSASRAAAQAWVQATGQRIEQLVAQPKPDQQPAGPTSAPDPAPADASAIASPHGNSTQDKGVQRGAGHPHSRAFELRHPRAAYLSNIEACRQALYAGDSYEVCLTTAMSRTGGAPPPLAMYLALRRANPAPYAAWLHCGPGGPVLACSSPERFLRGDRGGLLEARPIKGTAARHPEDPEADARAAAALAASEKERAENLMIVDLLRNDLGRVCAVGSVHVPGLMEIESYATVHQMVSTVRGLRGPAASIVDCIRAAFPGGSMTGAPKVRTMEIIDRLEGAARGVYSGSIGFIGFNDTFDLNIVIRTALLDTQRDTVTIGAGGAIVVQSEPDSEYEEMRLKARALLGVIGRLDAATFDDSGGISSVPDTAALAQVLD